MNRKGRIVAVCISDRTGIPKRPIAEGTLQAEWGLEGDAHAGTWHRQVSLLAMESIEKMRALGLNVRPGSFAENITTEGLVLHTLPVGTQLRLGEALAEVTQIGKVCHTRCAIYQQTGDCVMPREGIFVRILKGGKVAPGDPIEVLEDTTTLPQTPKPDRGRVYAVCLSEHRGTSKTAVRKITLQAEWGVVGDAHAGTWHRQVSLLAWESIERALARGLKVGPGSFAENITTQGLDLLSLKPGTWLRIGPALLEITQIGKSPHEHDVIRELVGDSVIPREGIFARVLEGGSVSAGDEIRIVRRPVS